MREIKFRAWFTRWRYMMPSFREDDEEGYYNVNLFPDGSFEATVKRLEHNKMRWMPENSKDVILMQYTGLKDKDGKEIYEGDVLHYKPDDVGKYFHCVNEGNFIISWHDGAFFVDWEAKLPAYKVGGLDIEVIGNIYENPELLEK